MRHIISFSTGLSSAITVERVIQRHGRDSVHIVFMDTLIEDADNYRFLADCGQRWGDIITLTEGRTPYEVAKDRQIIANQKIAPCTFELKIELFRDWLTANFDGQAITIHIGYDFTELHRCGPTTENYGEFGWSVDYPLLWKPYETRPYKQVARDWGIEPPRMYAAGYSHANCGGRCFKQGQGDWLRTLMNSPELYAEAEQWEQEMRDHPVRKNYAILRDQRGGKVRALTLKEFRLSQIKKDLLQPSLLDFSQGGCVYCGVGDLAVKR